MTTNDEIIEKYLAEVGTDKQTADMVVHDCNIMLDKARKDTAAQIFKEFEPFVDRNMLVAFEELKKKFGVD